MSLSKLWAKDENGYNGFVFSHVKTIYYNCKEKILLSDFLSALTSNGEITEVKLVDELPSDASENNTTIYLLRDSSANTASTKTEGT